MKKGTKKAMGEAKKKVDWNKENPEVEYVGSKITLPGDPSHMPLDDAINSLIRLKKDEDQVLNAVELIDAHPMDGAVALMKAMKRKYGWASPVPTQGFFGPTPPTLVGVKTGPNPEDMIQVVWGAFVLPGVEKPMNCGAHVSDGRVQFLLHGQVRKREMVLVKELAILTREILKNESIYKAKAIRLVFNSNGVLDLGKAPDFIATDYINPDELILNAGEGTQLETALWTPIRHTAACVKARIPLKRGILLEGPYGCGKTMAANVTAKVCVDNGWTFILLDRVDALKDALLFANRYAPAVVFSEDIDRLIEERDDAGNDMLNTIDGILSKDAKVITVLTTNFVEKLDRAMLRPGRLDAVISLRAPNEQSVERLVRLYGRDMLEDDIHLGDVGRELAGNIPATVREVVERSKLGMISRGDKELTAADLLIAARGMKAHLELLKDKPVEKSAGDRLMEAFRDSVFNGHGETLDRIDARTKEIESRV